MRWTGGRPEMSQVGRAERLFYLMRSFRGGYWVGLAVLWSGGPLDRLSPRSSLGDWPPERRMETVLAKRKQGHCFGWEVLHSYALTAATARKAAAGLA